MRPPSPGMDPGLEHPAIWPDVHNSLITAIRDELVPRIAPEVLRWARATRLCAGAIRADLRGSARHRDGVGRVGVDIEKPI